MCKRTVIMVVQLQDRKLIIYIVSYINVTVEYGRDGDRHKSPRVYQPFILHPETASAVLM